MISKQEKVIILQILKSLDVATREFAKCPVEEIGVLVISEADKLVKIINETKGRF